MDTQARQLVGYVEDIMGYFGTQNTDGECCENISHGEFRALRAALHQDVCTMQDIARAAAVTKSGATRIMSRLEDKGLAKREQDQQQDGRICCVTVTEEGKSLMNRIEDQLTNKMLAILAAMDPAMRDILLISLNAFLQTAQRQMTDRKIVDTIN